MWTELGSRAWKHGNSLAGLLGWIVWMRISTPSIHISARHPSGSRSRNTGCPLTLCPKTPFTEFIQRRTGDVLLIPSRPFVRNLRSRSSSKQEPCGRPVFLSWGSSPPPGFPGNSQHMVGPPMETSTNFHPYFRTVPLPPGANGEGLPTHHNGSVLQ